MIGNLSLSEYKEIVIRSLNSLDLDSNANKQDYIKKIQSCDTKEQCLDLYNAYKDTEIIDNVNLLKEIKKVEDLHAKHEEPKKRTLFDLIFNRG